ncbi:MAG: hypothetical protein WBQ36_05070 [Desulfobaccales bacterium]
MNASVQKIIGSGDRPNLECVRRWPSEQARTWSEGFIESSTKQPDIEAIILVGSASRTVSQTGDIDFIVIYSDERPTFNRPPMDVDILTYDRNSISKLLSEGHDLLGWAIRLGCIIYERNHYWTKLKSRWVNRLKFPSIDEARARASKAEQLFLDLSAVGDIDAANEMFITMLTHLARARLLEAGIFPASRPELVNQLQGISEQALAGKLEDALQRRWKEQESI